MAGDRFEKLVKLGSGSYGSAWLVCSKGCFGDKFEVLKDINLRGLCEKDIDQALTEVEVLARCDLHKQITQRRGLYFPDETIIRWLSQLVSALDYIHTRCILHRDVKPQNLFLTSKQSLKLGDFGIAKVFSSQTEKACTVIGTPFYLSPEVCKQEPYSYASDMWAAGCVLYETCCLCVPFTASNMAALAVQIELAQYTPLPSHCGQILHDLVRSLLTPDPLKRPSAGDIIKMDIMHAQASRNSNGNSIGSIIDSTTFTVIKHPKQLRKPSLASPELSAMIHKQRTHCFEGQRAAYSADNPRPSRRSLQQHNGKRSMSPCFNLFQNECMDKRVRRPNKVLDIIGNDTDSPPQWDSLSQDVYRCYLSPSSSHESQAVTQVKESLVRILGYETFENLLMAVRKKTEFEELIKIEGFSSPVLPIILLYIQMTNSWNK